MGIGERLRQYKRVLIIARKPSKDEFTNAAKVCAAGMGVIGVLGFVIFIAFLFSGL